MRSTTRLAGGRHRALRTDVYTDSSQQLASSLERRFDKTAALHDRSVGPRQELAVNGNSKGEAVSAGHAAQQGPSAQTSSTRQDSGQVDKSTPRGPRRLSSAAS